uniref:Putative ovule protein n=1 Tax=Solanum chacoense TaxID=4108 RepID=A0A0V0IBS6_SOLCH
MAVATIETKSYENLLQDLENTPSLKIMKRPLRFFGMTLLLFSAGMGIETSYSKKIYSISPIFIGQVRVNVELIDLSFYK